MTRSCHASSLGGSCTHHRARRGRKRGLDRFVSRRAASKPTGSRLAGQRRHYDPNFRMRTLLGGCALLALAGCGADDVASPGEGVIVVPTPTPSPTPSPTPTPTPTPGGPAADCPTGFTNAGVIANLRNRSEEHTSELQSLMRISYAVFCLKKKTQQKDKT